MLNLTGPQYRQLQDLLLSAFPTKMTLEKMVFFELNEDLERIAGTTGDQDDVVFQLLRWARALGRVEELITAACLERPSRSDLQDFARQMGVDTASSPVAAQGHTPAPQGNTPAATPPSSPVAPPDPRQPAEAPATTPTTAQIESYFQQLDWPFERRDERNWITGYKGDSHQFQFYVRITDNWLYVTVPFGVAANPATAQNLYEHLLHLDYKMNMAKFMLDRNDGITLTVEYPNENLQLSEFAWALKLVSAYMDQHYVELVRLATDPQARSSLKPATD